MLISEYPDKLAGTWLQTNKQRKESCEFALRSLEKGEHLKHRQGAGSPLHITAKASFVL
jgi:hypothetical protein